MPPIRIGFIGLTASPQSWGPRAHLPYLLQTPHLYTIHGICNSTLESSKAAIAAYNFPSTTRAYGSPAELAADPEVDLVVVSTRVDTHYAVTKPAVLAGKNTFVEWPLGANGEQAKELAGIAKSKGVKTVIGLQGRLSPAIKKIREIVLSGRIGRVLSVSVQAATPVMSPEMTLKYEYIAIRKVGGNMLTIMVMHALDAICYVHGELGEYTPLLANQIPYINVTLPDGTVERRPKDTPDQVIISGRFASDSSSTSPSAVFSFHMRGGKPFKDEPGLVWKVYGDKGEIEITCQTAGLQVGPPITVKVFEHANDSVEEVIKESQLDEGLWAELPESARNVGRLYEAYALGREEEYGDWDLALKRHEFLERAFEEGGL